MTFFQRMCAYLEYARTQKPPHYYTFGALRRQRAAQRVSSSWTDLNARAHPELFR